MAAACGGGAGAHIIAGNNGGAGGGDAGDAEVGEVFPFYFIRGGISLFYSCADWLREGGADIWLYWSVIAAGGELLGHEIGRRAQAGVSGAEALAAEVFPLVAFALRKNADAVLAAFSLADFQGVALGFAEDGGGVGERGKRGHGAEKKCERKQEKCFAFHFITERDGKEGIKRVGKLFGKKRSSVDFY